MLRAADAVIGSDGPRRIELADEASDGHPVECGRGARVHLAEQLAHDTTLLFSLVRWGFGIYADQLMAGNFNYTNPDKTFGVSLSARKQEGKGGSVQATENYWNVQPGTGTMPSNPHIGPIM